MNYFPSHWIAMVLAIGILFLVFSRFCIRDSKRRGLSPVLVFILVLSFFPIGLIAWLLFRPEPIGEEEM